MPVLNRNELEQSPLADLHAIASEVGVEGFRRLRREELVAAIVDHAEAGDAEGRPEAAEAGEDAGRRSRSGGRGGRGRAAEAEPPEARRRGGGRARAPRGGDESGEEPEGELRDEQEEERTGILDVLPNGAGFLRGSGLTAGRDDPHVSPAQIRRCELRAGDEVRGPVRRPRRSERHPALVRVEAVNGEPAEPPAERPRFDDATPAYATERLSVPEELALPPFGRGSRVAIVDAPGAEGSALLRALVTALRRAHPEVEVTVTLAGVRPEDVTEWRRTEARVIGGAADGRIDAQAQAAELALERAKRVAERGGHALLALDSLDALAPEAARRLFAAARRLEEAGSLTVIATLATDHGLGRLATTRVVLEADEGGGGVSPNVAASSGTLRADLLGAHQGGDP